MNPGTAAIPSSYRLAKLTGFHRAHVHRVLHLKAGVTLDFAVRLARAAGITLDELTAYIYRDSVLMTGELRRIDDRRADWLNEEAKKRRRLGVSGARSNGANSGNGSTKRRRK